MSTAQTSSSGLLHGQAANSSLPNAQKDAHNGEVPAVFTRPPDPNDIFADERVYLHPDKGVPCYQDQDGDEWEYEEVSRSWRPLIAQTYLQATYQGETEDGVEVLPPSLKRKAIRQERLSEMAEKKAKKAEKRPNTSVYVSKLSADVTLDGLREAFSKYGIIMEDFTTGLPKVKIYMDDSGMPKGDALVTYVKEESVALAVELMDGCPLDASRPEGPENPAIAVSIAKFREKSAEELAEAKSKKLHLDKKTLHRRIVRVDKKLDWHDEGPSDKKLARFAKMVVLKPMFTLEELEKDLGSILDIKEEIREECEKFGEVTNVVLYDLDEEGVVTVKFKDEDDAQKCIKLMHGRYFGGNMVSATLYDGKKYKRSKTDSEKDSQRLESYEKWLEQEQ